MEGENNFAQLFNAGEFQRWFTQARHTLESAGHDIKGQDYDWACFKAQQAGELAIKALLRGLGKPATGHSILMLMRELGETGFTVPESLMDCCRSLDRHYIPPRYPNVYGAGSPFEFYDERTAREAIEYAGVILEFIEKQGHD